MSMAAARQRQHLTVTISSRLHDERVTEVRHLRRMETSDTPAGGEFRTLFGAWCNPRMLTGLAGLFLFTLTMFYLGSDIDRAVSRLFFDEQACEPEALRQVCGVFVAAKMSFWRVLRQVLQYFPVLCALFIAVRLAADLWRGHTWAVGRVRVAVVALLSLALGPLLLVNGVLKEFWGRPRPVMTYDFGGEFPFVPAGQWSDLCERNCSFVSGEVAGLAWLAVIVPFFSPSWRPLVLTTVLSAVTLAGGMRIAFGAHYLSDVVLATLSSLVIFAGVVRLVEPPAVRNLTPVENWKPSRSLP
ncbi:MAG TPA: phosphatase PAP2 family protein [Rhizobiaceae bacterium]|nr:phosphatase PAP2 family protein [Rhizobiaceae bacterium]